MLRWSRIAAQLPGRTDNEIKNYWNTRLKKKLRNQGLDPATHLPVDSSSKQQQSDGTGDDTETVDGEDQASYCSDASAAGMKANETTRTQTQSQQQPPAAAKPNNNSKPRVLLKAFQGEDGNMVLLEVPRSPPAITSATHPAAQHQHHALKLRDADSEQSSSTDTIKSVGDHHGRDLQSSSRMLNLRIVPEEFEGGDDSSSRFDNNHSNADVDLSSNLSTVGLENHLNPSDLCHPPQPAGNHLHQQHAHDHHQHPHLVEDSEIPSNNNSSYSGGGSCQNSGSRDLLDVTGGGINPDLSGGLLFSNPTVSSFVSCFPPQPVDIGWQCMFGDIGQPSPGSFFGSLSTLPPWNYGQDVMQQSFPRVSQDIQRLEALLDQI